MGEHQGRSVCELCTSVHTCVHTGRHPHWSRAICFFVMRDLSQHDTSIKSLGLKLQCSHFYPILTDPAVSNFNKNYSMVLINLICTSFVVWRRQRWCVFCCWLEAQRGAWVSSVALQLLLFTPCCGFFIGSLHVMCLPVTDDQPEY